MANITTRETIQLRKIIEKDGINTVTMDATISSDINQAIDYRVSVTNQADYVENIDVYRAEIQEFETLAQNREDAIIAEYHAEETPVEEPTEEPA